MKSPRGMRSWRTSSRRGNGLSKAAIHPSRGDLNRTPSLCSAVAAARRARLGSCRRTDGRECRATDLPARSAAQERHAQPHCQLPPQKAGAATEAAGHRYHGGPVAAESKVRLTSRHQLATRPQSAAAAHRARRPATPQGREAVQTRLATAEISAGPGFRARGGRVSCEGLADDGASRIVKRYARQVAGCRRLQRSGFLPSAAERGVGVQDDRGQLVSLARHAAAMCAGSICSRSSSGARRPL